MMTVNRIAEALGGEVSGGQVLAPGPGHSAQDRSLSVKLDDTAPDGFLVHSFAGDDPVACRDHVRRKIGLSTTTTKKKKAKGGARPFSPTIAKHVYRLADSTPYLQVHRLADKSGFPQYHWDGEKWISGKPKGPKVPYLLPQLIAAAPTTPVYVVEGEKDADNLTKIGFVATCNSEGADNGNGNKWTSDLNQYFKDRDVYIIPDNDPQGRKHAEHVARNLDQVAKSVRIVELPGLPLKGDVSDWLESDTAGAKLSKLAKAAPLWEPPPESSKEEAEPTDIDVEIQRLAQLKLIEYEQQRKGAADKLDVRASILDKLVQAERERLGLDGGDDGKQGHAITFPEPEPWPEPVKGDELLDEIAKAIRRHVVLTDHARDTTALWTLHTYLIDRFLVSPRLGISSPTKGCGKTLLLDVLSRLVPRPLPTQNVTPAAIFRVVEAYQPTLLIDEADTFLYDNDDLRGVLNGNRKGSTVLRTVGDDHEPRAFSTYSAAAIALIGTLPDTLNDRSVKVELKRRLRSETAEPFRPDRADHLDVLARKAMRWAKDNAERIGEADPAMPDGIINRAADNWRPLLAIADACGEEWGKRARKAAEASRGTDADEASRLELLLGDIRDIRDEKDITQMSSGDLVQALVDKEVRPWKEMGKSRKPLTQDRLARMLRGVRIAPEPIRVLHHGGITGQVIEKQVRGYIFAHFEDAFARYLPLKGDLGCHVVTNRTNTGTSENSKVSQPEDLVTPSKCEKSSNDGLCDGVTPSKGVSGEKTQIKPNGGIEPGLSRRRIRELADWYKDETHRRYNDGTLDVPALDAELRAILREEVDLPEHVDIEFKRVMDVALAV
jgi:putative DNA primase/helicase